MAEVFPRNLIEREDWGAEEPKKYKTIWHPLTSIILTKTKTPRCTTRAECLDTVRSIQQRDKDSGQRDIRYNFIVGGDGKVYEGRSWCEKPKKSKLYPEQYGESIEIAFTGYKGTRPSRKEVQASWRVIKKGLRRMYLIENPTFYADL